MRTSSRRIGTLALTIACALSLGSAEAKEAKEKPAAPAIATIDPQAATKDAGRYPPEAVPKGQKDFDGAFKTAVGYRSTDRRFTVSVWESGPGVLQADAYPNDEYCLVLEGKLVVTNADGSKAEYDAGDSFVIPKGWAGTWDMKTRFKKQFVAFEETPQAADAR